MAKLSWNSFIEKHKDPIGYVASVSGRLRKGQTFDKNNKKLPTPYGLFCEWASKNVTGSWTSTKNGGDFIICVASKDDAVRIADKFGTVGKAKKSKLCANTTQIGFQDSSYGPLAKELGYSI